MFGYILKRLLAMVPTMIGITLITFLIINLAPGDPVATSFGQGGGGERGADSSGGGDSADRMADAIKAKKKLLGMVVEDRAVLALRPGRAGELAVDRRLGDLSHWARDVARTKDGRLLAVAGAPGVQLVDVDSGDERRMLPGGEDRSWSVAFSLDGAVVAASDIDGVLRTWEVASGALLAQTEPLGTTFPVLAFLEDGDLLAGGENGVVMRFAPRDLTVTGRHEDDGGPIFAMAVGGDRFWTGGYDRVLREWDAVEGEVLRRSELHGQAITDLALSPDGTRLATACDDRKIRVIDLAAWEAEPIVLEGHYKGATAVAWTPDGSGLFSGSRDESVLAWTLDGEGGPRAGTPDKVGTVHALLAISGDGVLVAADSWRKVPVWRRYLRWLWRTAILDFDRSFIDERPVIDKIARALPITLGLNVLAIGIIYLVAIPLGIWAAVKRGSWFDHASSVVLFVLYSIPNFWLATLLILAFSSKQYLDILPSVGLQPDNHQDLSYLTWLWESAKHLVLPVLVMTYAGFASLSRYARGALLETISADYVRTARAKGLEERAVVLRHAFRNALITIVTLVANLLPAMIGGSVIVEYIFTIQGMGKLGFDAILARDYPVIMAITTMSAVLTLLGILVSDILYGVVDPRVRPK